MQYMLTGPGIEPTTAALRTQGLQMWVALSPTPPQHTEIIFFGLRIPHMLDMTFTVAWGGDIGLYLVSVKAAQVTQTVIQIKLHHPGVTKTSTTSRRNRGLILGGNREFMPPVSRLTWQKSRIRLIKENQNRLRVRLWMPEESLGLGIPSPRLFSSVQSALYLLSLSRWKGNSPEPVLYEERKQNLAAFSLGDNKGGRDVSKNRLGCCLQVLRKKIRKTVFKTDAAFRYARTASSWFFPGVPQTEAETRSGAALNRSADQSEHRGRHSAADRYVLMEDRLGSVSVALHPGQDYQPCSSPTLAVIMSAAPANPSDDALTCNLGLRLTVRTAADLMMLAALTLASLGLLARASDLCPPACRCFDSLTTADCRDKGLTQIPPLPAGTLKLFILNNKIEEIPENGLNGLQVLDLTQNQLSASLNLVWPAMTNLTKLLLRDNNLASLLPAQFLNCPALVFLDLSKNHIQYLTPRFLYGLANLKTLLLSHNQIETLQTEVLDNVVGLTELHLNFNRLREIESGVFRSSAMLRKLDLSNNRIVKVEDGSFRGAAGLKHLDLSGNQLVTIPADSFSSLTALDHLYLTSNNLTDLSDRSLSGLNNLTDLDLSRNQLSSLPNDVFKDLAKLRFLDLFRNRLTELPPDVFRSLNNLLDLQLDRNQISTLPLEVFATSHKLQDLQLSHNHILELHPGLFANMPSLQNLQLAHNALTLLPEGLFHKLQALKELHLQYNRIAFLHQSVFDGLPKVTRVDLSNNRISSLQPDQFRELSRLKDLKLDGNQLVKLPSNLFTALGKLVTLDLGHNNLLELSSDTFKGLIHLKNLILSFNSLHSVHYNAFQDLGSLHTLLLQNNSLESLPPDLFHPLPKLRELNLDGNKLGRLNPRLFQRLKDLQELSLKSNGLQSLETKTLKPLKKLTLIYLSDNMWNCTSVDIFYLCNWIKVNTEKLNDKPVCYFPSESESPLLLLDHCAAAARCPPSLPLQVLSVLTPSLIAVAHSFL
ncbi:hypothetical protein CCH79_00019881 [Gambusia affinis]|uniref:LRRNT domain-containing protein n=1 Tax=Gambusia affinis TaxID=33528 RepID=A0A315W1G3_GAMAF|nr:hypothetical protein CCH79_00019881 [Gambusia affinis]